jgi:drug/metabolite transporter (DMT)-like permease
MSSFQQARTLLLFEAAAFATASAIHFGAFLNGYEHTKAGTAEAVIAAALLAGLALTWRRSLGLRAFVGAQAIGTFGVSWVCSRSPWASAHRRRSTSRTTSSSSPSSRPDW